MNARWMPGVLAGVLLTCAVGAEAHPQPTCFGNRAAMCDVNNSRRVTSRDARHVLQFVAGLRSLTPEQQMLADATGNGRVTAYDAMCIMQAAAGKTVPGSHCGECVDMH
jgi:hypothetical protein